MRVALVFRSAVRQEHREAEIMGRLNVLRATLLCILLISVVLLSTSEAAEDDFIVYDVFDDQPTGKVPDDWEVREGSEKNVEVVDLPDAKNKSLQVDASGQRTMAGRNWEPQMEVTTVEVDFMPVTPNGNFTLPYIGRQGAFNGGFAACILAFTRDLSYHNGGWVRGTIGDAEAGRWYHVKSVVYVEDQKFDLYFDNKEIAIGAAFRGATESVGMAEFGGGGKYLVDNLMVYAGTEMPRLQVASFGKLASTWASIKVMY